MSKKGIVGKLLVLAALVTLCASGLQAAGLQFERVVQPAASPTDDRQLDPRLLAAGALCVVVAIARRRRMD